MTDEYEMRAWTKDGPGPWVKIVSTEDSKRFVDETMAEIERKAAEIRLAMERLLDE